MCRNVGCIHLTIILVPLDSLIVFSLIFVGNFCNLYFFLSLVRSLSTLLIFLTPLRFIFSSLFNFCSYLYYSFFIFALGLACSTFSSFLRCDHRVLIRHFFFYDVHISTQNFSLSKTLLCPKTLISCICISFSSVYLLISLENIFLTNELFKNILFNFEIFVIFL